MIRHLYVHIPFCPKLCPYCSFYSEVSDRNKTRQFLDALLLELDRALASHDIRPETIFFGGGTPSALSTPQLDYLLTGLRRRLILASDCEWTLEMNPATVSLEKARLLRDLGVNRISMGVQSWDEELLRTLGRVHSGPQAERSFLILREAGFANVNLDLMFAVPGQTMAQWEHTLEKTIALDPEHISAYCLTYEEDTEYFDRLQQGVYRQEPAQDADLFELTMETLTAAGFDHYEISNYARPGRECRHNLAYWLGSDYLGIGPSAFSTIGDRRWQNVPSAEIYTGKVAAGESPICYEEPLSEPTRKAETLAFSLRTNRGVARADLAPWPGAVEEFTGLGLLRPEGDRLVLTTGGKMVADTIAETFV